MNDFLPMGSASCPLPVHAAVPLGWDKHLVAEIQPLETTNVKLSERRLVSARSDFIYAFFIMKLYISFVFFFLLIFHAFSFQILVCFDFLQIGQWCEHKIVQGSEHCDNSSLTSLNVWFEADRKVNQKQTQSGKLALFKTVMLHSLWRLNLKPIVLKGLLLLDKQRKTQGHSITSKKGK